MVIAQVTVWIARVMLLYEELAAPRIARPENRTSMR
jgi:hypothetical protein